ncbi:hypothetical protein LXL04_029380 [Taraxacum kok-saghyz]
MESMSVSQPSPSTDNKPNCICPEGWKCTITKTEPTKMGKSFANCGGSDCSCVTEKKTMESTQGAKVFCECSEGWSCVVSNEAGKTYFECGEGCICVIDQANNVKIHKLGSLVLKMLITDALQFNLIYLQTHMIEIPTLKAKSQITWIPLISLGYTRNHRKR